MHPKMKQVKVGDKMKDSKRKTYKNTSFFNALQEGLRNLNHPAGYGCTKWGLDEFIDAGDWDSSMKGQPVVLGPDSVHLEILANSLIVSICIYDEMSDGQIRLHPFGFYTPMLVNNIASVCSLKEINLVKVYNKNRYKLLLPGSKASETDELIARRPSRWCCF